MDAADTVYLECQECGAVYCVSLFADDDGAEPAWCPFCKSADLLLCEVAPVESKKLN